jgi:putative ABC transport system permease protein
MLKLIFRDLLWNKKVSLAIIIVNWLGFLSFGILEHFNVSFEDAVDSISKNLLSADLSISSRIDIPEQIRSTIQDQAAAEGWQTLAGINFYTMLRKDDKSLLVNVRAVEKGFPFYGKITGTAADGSLDLIASMHADQSIWATKEVLAKLSANPGDRVTLGNQTLVLSHAVEDDTTVGLSSFDLAPRIYVDKQLVQGTGLIQEGSVSWKSIYLKVPDSVAPAEAKRKLLEHIKDPAIRVQTHDDHENSRSRVINYLTDYLWLISLICVLLTATGVSYQFRSYLAAKKSEIALLLCLGTAPLRIVISYLSRIAILCGVASGLTISTSALALPVFQRIFEQFVALPSPPSFSWESAGKILAVSIAFPILVCLPFCLSIFSIKPSSLFREDSPTGAFSPTRIIAMFPALLLFAIIAVVKSNSFYSGLLFFGIVLGSITVFLLTSKGLILLLNKANIQKPIELKLGSRYLTRNPTHTSLFVVALGLSTLLISVGSHLRSALTVELESPSGKRSDLFVFDIQEDQLEDVRTFYAGIGGLTYKMAPMIRGRMTKINGEILRTSGAEEPSTREDERSEQSRNRSVNLSYEEKDVSENSIVAGLPFSKASSKYAKVSLEENYASRVGLALNDVVTFDVMGKEIEGEVVNLRKVNWTNFEPNFFIVLEPSSLRDAPKTYVGSLSGLQTMQDVYKLQTEIANQFPNMSVVNVRPIIDQIIGMVSKLSLIVNFMSLFSLLVGLFVVAMILQHRLHSRRRDYQLITLLGGARKIFTRLVFAEIAILTFGATFVAVAAGAGMSYLVVEKVFDHATINLGLVAWGLLASLCIPFVATLFVRSQSGKVSS